MDIKARTHSQVPYPLDAERSAEDILLEVRAEVRQGFDRLAVKVVADIKDLIVRSNSSTLAIHPSVAFDLPSNNPSQQSMSKYVPFTAAPEELITDSLDDANIDQSAWSLNKTVDASFSRTDTEALFRLWRSSISSLMKAGDLNVESIIEGIQESHSQREASRKRCMYRFVFSRACKSVCALLIFANAVWLGYESDHHSFSESGWRKSVSLSFNSWFIAELFLKIIALRREFIFGPDWPWNLLDALSVLSSIPDFFSTSMNMSFLRIMRVSKLMKGLRLMRVLRFITSLRLILTTVFLTLESLFWSFVAIFFVAYIFAILFQQALSIYLEDGIQFSPLIMENFKSVWNAMLALFSFITGGQDWYEFSLEFEKHGAYVAQYGLLLWIFFMVFGLVNVVIAVFCTRASDAKSAHADLRISTEISNQREKIHELMYIFRSIDVQRRGFIMWEQFHTFGTCFEGQAYLRSYGLQLLSLQHLWRIMNRPDSAETGRVEMIDFVMGFLRLTENTLGIELEMLSVKVKELHQDMRDSFRQCRNDVREELETHAWPRRSSKPCSASTKTKGVV